jgi:threonine dehydrogenase-like Zn-dependent dehydrogenase
MGSTAEFNELCKFLAEKKVSLEGLVDSIFKGLESADEAFEKMKNASQFGTYPSCPIISYPLLQGWRAN